MDRIVSSPIILSDSLGNPLNSIEKDRRVQIVGSITNEQNFDQKFVYLIQIKDQFDSVVSISWITGELSDLQNLDVSQSWLPKNSGHFSIETYVWNSISEQIPLSSPNELSIVVN
jgi:hypothetical protein